MKFLIFVLAATTAVATTAQTTPKPATPTSGSSTKTASTGVRTAASTATGIKLPPGVKPVKGIVKTAFSLRYQDISIGTGANAEPGKLFSVNYTGYRAADGVKFDSSYDRREPMLDKDHKPVMGDDGKPKMSEPHAVPMKFPQGMGRLIPGFDQGFAGMKVGGKRRIFIPWQLAYGTREIPERPDHPGIPAKSDLIFDVELMDVTDLPAMPQRPGMMPGRPMPPRPGTPGAAPAPGAAPTTGASPSAPAPSQPTAPSQPATTPQPTTPQPQHN